MTEYLPHLLLAWSIQFSGVLSPGPSVAVILGVAAEQGRAPALITAAGVGAASIVLSLATVLGLAVIFAEMAELMTLVRVIGAAYLAWLAYGSFRKVVVPPDIRAAEVGTTRPLRLATRGFLLQLSNPKAILFWLAIASIGGLAHAPAAVVVVFVVGAFVISAGGHGAWAMLLSAAPFRRAYATARRPIEAALGGFFAFAAFRLATARS